MLKTAKRAVGLLWSPRAALLCALGLSVSVTGPWAAETAWKPDKAIEIIATNTPVAHLFGEYVAVTLKPDSALKSARDIVERLKPDPPALSFGVATSVGGPNHQGAASAASEFKGSAETIKFLERENVQARAFLAELGLVK